MYTVILYILFGFVGPTLIPGIVQVLRVSPNEINLEKPYIENNIKFILGFVVVFAVTFIAFFFLVLPYLFGITQSEAERAIYACVFTCKTDLITGRDLSSGPCISNEIIPGWVCDVAHYPRIDIDNDPANQCSEYGISASHFVEVNETCYLIRVV